MPLYRREADKVENAPIAKRDMSYTQNRELSWLKFNERVLAQATDPTLPLMERLRFVSIFTSNLDEFFMVRVGSLIDMDMLAPDETDNKSGMTPKEQVSAICAAATPSCRPRTSPRATSMRFPAIFPGTRTACIRPCAWMKSATPTAM